jgi:hypothetical protein
VLRGAGRILIVSSEEGRGQQWPVLLERADILMFMISLVGDGQFIIIII